MTTSRAARFAAAYAALTASHEIADHLVQTDHQALHKGKPGTDGRAACAAHVATYTLALAAANRSLRLGLNWRHAAAGLALSGLTHYAIDRSGGRWTEDPATSTRMVRAAHAIGKGAWLQNDPQAGYRYDQALHKGLIALAAAVTARR